VRYLRWELRYQRDGHSIDTLVERGVSYESLPEWFRDEPDLESWDLFYHNAFWRLSTERSIGFAMGPIPHSKILEYAYEAGLESGTIALFEAVIRQMDSAYVEWSAEQQTRARKANQQPSVPVGTNKTKQPKPR
jgi:hypothetical protein